MAILSVQKRREAIGRTVESIIKVEDLVARYMAGENTPRLAAKIWTAGTVATLGMDHDKYFIGRGKALPEHYGAIYKALSERLEAIRVRYMDNLTRSVAA